jgi:hypothetical protein
MRRVFKTFLWGVAIIVAFGAAAVAYAEFGSRQKLNRVVALNVQPVAAATSAAALERGRYLFDSRGCAECHGANGAGKIMIDSSGFFVKTPNITPAEGSVVANFTDLDWVKVIRHGVKPDNRPLLVMPSEDFARYTNDDIAAIIGYAGACPRPPARGPSSASRFLSGCSTRLASSAMLRRRSTTPCRRRGLSPPRTCSPTAAMSPTPASAAITRPLAAARSRAARPTGRQPPT